MQLVIESLNRKMDQICAWNMWQALIPRDQSQMGWWIGQQNCFLDILHYTLSVAIMYILNIMYT